MIKENVENIILQNSYYLRCDSYICSGPTCNLRLPLKQDLHFNNGWVMDMHVNIWEVLI